MIMSSDPTGWQDLQEQVGRVMRECGFKVKIEETITTVRGPVTVDVLAEEDVEGRKYKILCECKHWRRRVPQSIVHGFRTIVTDAGAHAGYIVSSVGFQSGAYSAADLTNINIL